MNRDRLTRLAVLLDRVEADERGFDMGVFYDADRDCGTVACALGWAALSPEFQAEGLTLGQYEYPTFENKCAFEAASAFFDITGFESRVLFSIRYYSGPPDDITAADVAARVRELLASEAP